jgi:hypothetical protein
MTDVLPEQAVDLEQVLDEEQEAGLWAWTRWTNSSSPG